MNPSIFDACESSKDCECYHLQDLNFLKAKVFASGKKNDSDALKVSEPRYGPKVLLGNWFEERVNAEPLPPLPEALNTSYNEDFKPCNREKLQIFAETRETLQRLRERSKGVGSRKLIEHHGNAYYNNYSTTNDLIYRIFPNGLSGPPERTYNAKNELYIPEQDLAKNFGNTYGYGYREYIERKRQETISELTDIPRSIYQCDYTKKNIPDMTKRYPLKRADMNRPDLRHLDIDLDAKWCRQFTHGYHRINCIQQKIHGLRH